MRPVQVTAGPLTAASVNNIAISQAVVSGVPMTINGSTATGGVATLDKARRVLLTFGNETVARTLVLTGTNWSGAPISETLAVASGAPGTVASALDYLTVTNAVPAGGGWSDLASLGTNAQASSPWVCFDQWGFPQVTVQCTVSGTVNYTVQQTMDDPNALISPVTPALMTWLNSSDPNVVAQTTSQASSFGFAPVWARVVLNSGTGSVTATFWQAAVYPQ